jgi:hypothetical protein
VVGTVAAQLLSSLLAAAPAALAPFTPPSVARPLVQLLALNSPACQAACLAALAALAAHLPPGLEPAEAALRGAALALRAWAEGGLAPAAPPAGGGAQLSAWEAAALGCAGAALRALRGQGLLGLHAAEATELLLDAALAAAPGGAMQRLLLEASAGLLAEQPALAPLGARLLPLLLRGGSWCAGLARWLAALGAWLASAEVLPLLRRQLRASPAAARLLGAGDGARPPAAAAAAEADGGASVSPARKRRKLRQAQLAVGRGGALMTQQRAGSIGTQAPRARTPAAPAEADPIAGPQAGICALAALAALAPLGPFLEGLLPPPSEQPPPEQVAAAAAAIEQLAAGLALGGPLELLLLLAGALAAWLDRSGAAAAVRGVEGAAAVLGALHACCSALLLQLLQCQGGAASHGAARCREASAQLLAHFEVGAGGSLLRAAGPASAAACCCLLLPAAGCRGLP